MSSWEEQSVGKQIGRNLRQLRQQQKWSLETFAKKIGVSKLTLLKIEQGEANPTLSVIWKIADGLKISISSLFSFESDVTVIRSQNGIQLGSADKEFVVEPLFHSNGVEQYRATLQANSSYLSEGHQAGVMECITVMSGEVTVEVDGEQYDLKEHDAIRFNGNMPHRYINQTSTVTTLHFVISYHS